MKGVLLPLAAGLVAAASPAAAQDDPFLKCARLTDDAARLACFDAAAEARYPELRAAAEQRRAAAVAAARKRDAEAAARKLDRFGAEALPNRPVDSDVAEELTVKVNETLLDRVNNTVFILANGQIWRQIEGFNLPPVRVGDEVRIKRGPLGNYMLTLTRQKRTVPVRRLR